MKSNESNKLFDFIITSKDIPISDNDIFSRDTLISIRKAIKNNEIFKLTKQQEKALFNSFIKNNRIFDEDTPLCVMNNGKTIKQSLMLDINSVKYLKKVKSEFQPLILSLILEKDYIITEESPNFLKKNYFVAKKSIHLNVNSANFIDINSDNFSTSERESLINDIIKLGFTLSLDSKLLKNNEKIVLASIKKDINTTKYADLLLLNENKEIFEYLLIHDYQYVEETLYYKPLITYKKPHIFKKALSYLYNIDENNKLLEILYELINVKPKISNFNELFQLAAEKKWEEYKLENLDNYENIFGKICSLLRTNNKFPEDLINIDFIYNMQETLQNKYQFLYNAMKEFFTIYHSNDKDKFKSIQKSKDIIAYYSALYVAKSKEKYKKEEIDEFYSTIKNFFIPKKDNPIVLQKVIAEKKNNEFIDKFLRNDTDIVEFINLLLDKYKDYFEQDNLYTMIKQFILNRDNSKYKTNFLCNKYKIYLKVQKLINRLNQNYISYNGIEVQKYKKYITYDEKNNTYFYNGYKFDEPEILKCKKEIEKEKVFNKIKREIINKINSQNIKINIHNHDLYNLTNKLPFTDDFFEFDEYYALINYTLKQLTFTLQLGTILDKKIDMSSTSTYNFIKWLLIEKSLGWATLLNYNHNYTNDILTADYSINMMIQNANHITKISKETNIQLDSIKNLILLNKLANHCDNQTLAILGYDLAEQLITNTSFTSGDAQIILGFSTDLICYMSKRNKSTVPYIEGQTSNYKFSLYDSLDNDLLTCGFETNSCFRIDGNDHDFLHYCALDKNGFVIKITDYFNNFIAKASGFRNGNCIFINQLRTIYDEGNNIVNNSYVFECEEIIETFKKACEEFIIVSQANNKEEIKIDFVFVTKVIYSIMKKVMSQISLSII